MSRLRPAGTAGTSSNAVRPQATDPEGLGPLKTSRTEGGVVKAVRRAASAGTAGPAHHADSFQAGKRPIKTVL